MAVIATVAIRPLATRPARLPPAISICDSTQPPNISPLPFMSAGCGTVRMIGSRTLSGIFHRRILLLCRDFTTIPSAKRSPGEPPARPHNDKKKHGPEKRRPYGQPPEKWQEWRPVRAVWRQAFRG